MLPTKIATTDKVLIVDDTKTIVQILTMVLQKEGFQVFTASSGEEAIELLQNISVDTILLDIQMGKGIDGFETCRRLKYYPKTKDIPVIFLTAFDDLETKLKGFEVGGVDFVAKSFDKTEILTRVKNQTNLFKLQNSLKRGLAYIKAILDAQKHMIAIFDANMNLENYNQIFSDTFGPESGSSLVSKLTQYDGYKLPQSDAELLSLLGEYSDFKAEIKGRYGIFSFEMSEAEVLNETKKILTITDITIHEVVKKQELELLKYQERYHNTQQQDAFKKQKKIIKDEVSHLFKNGWLFDSYYKPLDILSGDTLGAIKIKDDRYLFYIVDAMGKGLSASVTSIQSTSFINNSIERAIEHNDFELAPIVDSFCHFIRKQLLDDELLCVVFLDFDIGKETMHIANYGMPPMLIEQNGVIQNIRPNNPPIMPFLATSNIDSISLEGVSKIAMYSDGLNETEQTDQRPYAKNIEEDFKNSMLLRQFLREFSFKIGKLEDDLTLIYISKFNANENVYNKKIEIASKLSEVISVSNEVEEIFDSIGIAKKESAETLLIFGELLMNAFEHGVLRLTPNEKQRLIENDEYDEYLTSFDNNADKKPIFVELNIYKTKQGIGLLKISIADPGSGFEFSEVLKTIYLDSGDRYSGRGVWMANDITDGVFFSETGNKTTFFKTIKLGGAF